VTAKIEVDSKESNKPKNGIQKENKKGAI